MTAGDYDGGLGQAVEELRRLAEASERGEPPVGQGESASGMVTATVANGRLTSLEINPKAMRLASQELAEAITEAVNAAMNDLESKYPVLPLATIDPARLQAQLTEAHEQGIREMRRFTESISDAMSRFGR